LIVGRVADVAPEVAPRSADALANDSRVDERRLRDRCVNNPGDLQCRRELAAMLLQTGRAEEAVSILAEAIRIDFRDVPTLVAFAHAQRKWGNLTEAEQACLLALEQDPEHPEALAALAHVLIARDRVADAIPILERSLELQSDNVETRRLYGVALEVVGRLDEARRELLQVITNDPSATKAYISLSEIEVFTPDHDLLRRMHATLAMMPRTDDLRLVPLYYSLGKAYDDIGDYDRAFSYFQSGAKLQRSRIGYDEQKALALLEDVMAVFTSTLVARHPPVAADRPAMTPVFIVGMPRSGSTLLEQILSRHSQVFCCGETNTFGDKLAMIRRDCPELPFFPEFMRSIDREALARVSAAYHTHMRELGGSAHIFVNKLLINFIFMGAIHMAMPDARFVVTRRNALDTCLSAFASYFEFDIPYSYDLAELGRFYRKFEQVVAHWSQVLPEHVMRTVDYEKLVSDLEGQTRSLLDFVGLAWEPACLAFHRSKHPARTASVAQVRRPLYQSSIGRWRRYERHLQPLIEALEIGRD